MKKVNLRLMVALLAVVLVTMVGVVVVHRIQLWRNAGGLARLAAQRLADGRKDEALGLYSRYVTMRPDDADAYAAFAKLVLDRAESSRTRPDMLAIYKVGEDAVRKKPDDRALRMQLATFLLRAGNGSEARDHLTTLRKSIPEAPPAEAADGGEKPVLADCDNPLVLDIALARAETAMGRFEEGLATAARIIGFDVQTKSFADDAPALPGTTDAYILTATILVERSKDLPAGHRVMARLVEAFPEDAVAWLSRARWNRQYGLLDLASEDMDKATTLAPDNPDVLFTAFEVALARKDYVSAQKIIEQGLDRFDQDERVVRGRAMLAIQQQQLNRAAEVLEEGLRARPGQPTFLMMLIDTEFLLNRIDDVEKNVALLREAVGKDHPAVGIYEARTMIARQQWNQARRRLDEVRPTVATSEELTNQVDLYLGQCYEKLGQIDQQVAANRRVLQETPESIAARVGMASAMAAAGRRDEALAEFESMARTLAPERLATLPQIWRPLLELRINKQLQRPPAERDWTSADAVVAMLTESASITDAQLALLQAELLIHKDEMDAAIDLLRRSREAAPDDLQLVAGLTKLLAQGSRSAEARQILDALPPASRQSPTVLTAEARITIREPKDVALTTLARIEKDAEALPKVEAADVLANVANSFGVLGEQGEAERLWKRVLEKNPEDMRIRSNLLELAHDAGNLPKVREYATGIVDVSEANSPQGRVARAMVLLVGVMDARRVQSDKVVGLDGNEVSQRVALDEARNLLLEAESERPAWPLIQRLFADVAGLQGDIPGAIGHLREALARGATNPVVSTRLAALLYDSGQLDEARNVLAKLGGSAAMGVDRITAELRLKEGRKDEAADLAIKAVPPESTQPEAFQWLGRLLSRCGEGSQAEAALARAAALAPTRGELWIELVGLQLANGQRVVAEQTLEKAIEQVEPARREQFAGVGFEVLGQNDLAEKHYRNATASHPEDFAAARSLADFLLRRGRTTEARTELLRICEIPSSGSVPETKRWARRTVAMLTAENATFRGLEQATALIEQNVGDDGKRAPEDLELLVSMLSDRQEPACWRRSIELLLELRRQRPLTTNQRILMAQLHNKLGDWEACRRELVELVASPSSPPWLYSILIELLISHKEMESARTWMQKLQSVSPGTPMALALEAKLAEAVGDRERAIAAARQLMPSGPVPPEQAPQLAMVAKLLEELKFPKAADKVLTQYAELSPQGVMARAEFLGRQNRVGEALDLLDTLWPQVSVERVLQSAVNICRTSPDAVDAALRQRIHGWFERAKRQDPGAVRIEMVEALLQESEGRLAEAEGTYRGILERPDVSPIHTAVVANNLAFLKAHPDTVDEARRLIDTAILELGPHPDLLDTRGLVWLAAGESDRAIDDIMESVLLPSPAKYLHLALAQLQAKQKGEARVSLEKARQMGLDEKQLSPDDRKRLQAVEEAVNQSLGA
jgi:tetratricopeptide (TPR) repeat protein